MKKVLRFFAIAALAFGMTNLVACGGDEEEGDDNNNNTQQEEQGEPILLEENFDNGIPSTWTNIDADGDGLAWISDEGNFGDHGGNGQLVYSQSFDNNFGVLTPDNYLVTPTIHIPNASGYKLTFWVCGQDASYAAEHYAVYVGKVENGTFVANGNALFEETIGSKAQSPWVQKTVNLDAYKGQDVQIAFRHFDCSDMFYLDLDDVKVSNQ